LQVVALGLLAFLQPAWPRAPALAYVMGAQALSGIAKDLTKMSAKSAIKLLVPADAHGALFRWVAVLTGSKNALKGVGFFLGGWLLGAMGFRGALLAMAAALAATLVTSTLSLPRDMGRSKGKARLAQLFAKTRAINVLSLARFFLFGARDVWFVVGVPVFLAARLWSGDAAIVAGIAALAGHILPVWLHFKGGKGVATYIGVLFGLFWPLGVLFILIWLIIAFGSRISSLAALAATAITAATGFAITEGRLPFALLVIAVVIFITHRANLLRLLRNQEPKISFTRKA